ncbi:hypothetical protein [Kribbella lupini]|uniref:DUF559 domain-containing protein n=1 Tax=Kribbella lupini TaxID=291602 RepID=A0ABN2A8V5_9ACTN
MTAARQLVGMERLKDEVRSRLAEVRAVPQGRAALWEFGLRDHDLRRLVRNERLRRFHHHYLDGGWDELTARAACAQAAYSGSVISHFTAAELDGLSVWCDQRRPGAPAVGAIWLTRQPAARRNQRRSDIVVRRAGLPRDEQLGALDFPRTTTARTVVDLARELPFREAVVTADHALRRGVDPDALQLVLDRQHQWPGVRRARETIAFADARSESALESIARAAFASGGLPAPILQASFWTGSVWMPERVDFWWPEFRTVAEADGLAKYDGSTAEDRRWQLRRGHLRDQRLSDRDVELVHFGWEDVAGDPGRLIHRLRTAFTRAERRTGEPPVWSAPSAHQSQ